jgi:hypothetical protein
MAYNIKPKDVKRILEIHDRYWDEMQREMWQYKSAYETDFWDKEQLDSDMQILVQTSDAYGYIESYIASLFSRNPGVVFKQSVRGVGDSRKAQTLANDFLVKHRSTIEDASRLALIYPMAFMKMLPIDSEDIYKRMDMMAVNCWDVILDRDAKRLQDQRYMGHRYYIPLHEAKAKFGNKEYEPVEKKDYFTKYMNQADDSMKSYSGTDEMFRYIEIIEFYDLVNDQIYFYTPNWAMGEKFLDKEMIPFRDNENKPVVPIVPFYFNRKPDCPIEGYSAMKRIYDQIYETNLIRTFQANGVRKASRQYIVKRGTFDEESMAQVTSGIDGLFIEVDDDDLNGAIRTLPQNPTPPELEQYYQQVQRDKDKGSILAPFTRGESTRSSATEIAALAAYSSSEVGRLARERDATIEELARIYIFMLAMYMEEDNTRDVVVIDNRDEVVKASDLRGDFQVFAQDQASTPISESVRKREFIQSIPTLQGLGVPASTLLAEMVRALGLPESFIEEANQAAQAQISAAKAKASGAAIQPDAVELQQGMQPTGPNNLQAILNTGEG